MGRFFCATADLQEFEMQWKTWKSRLSTRRLPCQSDKIPGQRVCCQLFDGVYPAERRAQSDKG